jgi:hypothetical protein
MQSGSKFTRKDIEIAINRLKLMKFFPGDPGAQASLGELLARICPSLEALEWLTRTLLDRVPEWPGAHEVRGVLCTKYDAADGIDAYCSIPGFRAADFEAQAYDRHQAIKSGGWQLPDEALRRLAQGCEMKQLSERKPNR